MEFLKFQLSIEKQTESTFDLNYPSALELDVEYFSISQIHRFRNHVRPISRRSLSTSDSATPTVPTQNAKRREPKRTKIGRLQDVSLDAAAGPACQHTTTPRETPPAATGANRAWLTADALTRSEQPPRRTTITTPADVAPSVMEIFEAGGEYAGSGRKISATSSLAGARRRRAASVDALCVHLGQFHAIVTSESLPQTRSRGVSGMGLEGVRIRLVGHRRDLGCAAGGKGEE
jgi:hypothetical protein